MTHPSQRERVSTPTHADMRSARVAWQAVLSYDAGSWNEAWPAQELFPTLLRAAPPAPDDTPRP